MFWHTPVRQRTAHNWAGTYVRHGPCILPSLAT